MTCFCYLCTLLGCFGNALQIDIHNKDSNGVDTKPKDVVPWMYMMMHMSLHIFSMQQINNENCAKFVHS